MAAAAKGAAQGALKEVKGKVRLLVSAAISPKGTSNVPWDFLLET